ncbi:GAF domain-containing protein [candidate division KSB1 bacterium]|nr:GAF domain-containing protein [candidate division KSB1 bacterium]
MKKLSLFLSIVLFIVSGAFAAEIGKPFMTIYTSKEIKGHTQFWAMAQNDRGIMYIGDGFGVQEFDGSNWRLILNPNNSFARSLSTDKNGRVYVGSSGMLGYLDPDEHGQMQYCSLMDYIEPEDRLFNYVWSVHATHQGIYFQTSQMLFRFNPQVTQNGDETWQVETWKAQNIFGYTFWIDETLFVQQFDVGLMRMVNDSLVLMPGGQQFAGDRIHVMLPFPGKPFNYLLGTFSRGLFLWNGSGFQPFPTDADESLRSGTLYAGVITPDSCFAIGNLSGGLFIIDKNGGVKHQFDVDDGFTSNCISALFVDEQQNLWVGMDGGVAVLEYNSPLTTFSMPGGSGPSDFCRHNGILYIAVNDGLYYLDDTDGFFKSVEGIAGNAQSFYFLELNDELFVTVNTGIYRIKNKESILALPNQELSIPMLYLCRMSLGNDIVVGGTSDGIVLLRYDAHHPDRFHRLGQVTGTHEYVRTVIESKPGIIWVGTMDGGVIRLTFDVENLLYPMLDKFGVENGLPPGGVNPIQIAGKLVFCTSNGVYQFDQARRKFSRDPFFDGVRLGRKPDEGVIVADLQGNIWLNLAEESAVYKKLPNGEYRLEKDQLARFADELINTIYARDDDAIWFGTPNNVIRFAPDQLRAEQADFPALIRRVAIAGDSVIYNGAVRSGSRMDNPADRKIPFRYNALRFDFSASSYLNPRANQFRSRLDGFDADWSAWSIDNRRYYTNLPAGKYHFRVQARNIFQHESSEDMVAFTITPPLYGTWWAWGLYILGAAGLIFGLVRVRTHQLQERGRALEKVVEERTAEIHEQKNNVEQLSRIGRDITENLSIKGIIDTVYKNVNTMMNASVFGIGLYQEDQKHIVFPATKEKGETLPEFTVPLSDDDRLAVWCLKNQKDVFINDYSTDYVNYIRDLKPPMAGENPESILYLPLLHKDRTIGVITAQSFSKNAYTEYHLNILRNLAAYSAIALENADAYRQVNELLINLKNTQDKLVTQSKLAALGALTAGIAHEIKNPLNFVNNFAVLSRELIQELREELSKDEPDQAAIDEILQSLELNNIKINEHGKRADSIVRSMLLHSRGKAGERQPTDLNAILEEDINLAYHGMRAQDSNFNIKIEKDFDTTIGKLDVVPQDISRVFLNIINNGCYEAHRKKMEQGGSFSPQLSVSSRNMKDHVEIRIRDNGNGVPSEIREKLFTPFFTTKPAGQGTGLGLSISYEIIVHGHNGAIEFDSKEGEFTEFIIRLPGTSR